MEKQTRTKLIKKIFFASEHAGQSQNKDTGSV